jgi:hypothetical protein
MAVAILLGVNFYLTPAGAQSAKTRLQQDIEQVFTQHEDLSLDPQAAAQRVRETGRLSLVTATRDFEIQLRPNDLRAPNYRAEEVGSDGARHAVSMPAINTYQGSVEGATATDARFTLDGDHIEGMIITPQGSYFVESASKYSTAATTNDYLIYRDSDVRSSISRSCATLDEEISRGAKGISPQVATAGITPDAFSPFKVVEIATEADGEYTAALGGSANANNDILGIMNQVQAIYQRDIGLTFSVVFQHTWTDPNTDPYSASGPVAMVSEFQAVWNRDFPTSSNPRDVAHMWTGRSLGGPNGIAFMGVVCSDPAASYGVSDLETIAPFKVTIPAHEIGHNFNASHSDNQAGCDNSIMVAIQSQSNTSSFCQFSIDQITAFVNANSSCLSNAVVTNPIDQPDFFVKQQYLDFLNRTADPSGLAFWTGQLTSCGTDATCMDAKRVNVSAAFFISTEFQETGYLVERLYKTAYGDARGTSTLNGTHTILVPIVRFSEFLPDTRQIGNGVVVGQNGWEAVLERNKAAYIDQFVALKRFTDAYPSTMVPTTFVDTLNRNAGSPLSTSELATLEAQHLTGQANRAKVLRTIAEHPNLVFFEYNKAFLLMQFFGYLRRNPNDAPDTDYTGYEFWLSKLNNFTTPGDDVLVRVLKAEMVKGFLVSGEYRKRFGTP